ncbi:uncharacterized protein N7515_009983 [Penicillium bovifimosum]|uniref:Uncharacterized protein n=1 Tax=Penicillium bovifimosum TaxID=126998 RepID=A0A9W9GI14_9EURO|nr:uncharacterized protein N7515_009983 [Penicillium bovifimosum]KAJ5120595.1 hypothetical protein N7515_009983 [Penicillium bovifimosum]
MFSLARQFTGVISKPRVLPHLKSTLPHRLYSTRSSPRTPPPAPQRSRSDFPIIPIILITAISSGAYAYLVKARTGINTRQN